MESIINNLKQNAKRYFEELSSLERENLSRQIESIDWQFVSKCVQNLDKRFSTKKINFDEILPCQAIDLLDFDESFRKEVRLIGESAIKNGKIALFTAAGGQGTRLGVSIPKGLIPVSLVKQKTLFEIFYEKILFVRNYYGCQIHWFLMTSDVTHDETVSFFEKNSSFFDLNYIHFLKQKEIPIISENGDILLESKGKIAMNPNGHGGFFETLKMHSCFDLMRKLGIEHLSYIQVDNPLIRAIDPYFIGLHLLKGSEFSSKTVLKEKPEEKVGLFVKQKTQLDENSNTAVIEYNAFPENLANKRDSNGNLVYNAGNIAAHVIDVQFSENISNNLEEILPYHWNIKDVCVLNEKSNFENTKAFKLERFIFDALPFAKRTVVLRTQRNTEFSPIKNAFGNDSLETAQKDLLNLFKIWLTKVNQYVPLKSEGSPLGGVEISPTFADSEEIFVEKWNQLVRKPEVSQGLYLS